MVTRRTHVATFALAVTLLMSTLVLSPAAGLFVGGAGVEGWVTGHDDGMPVEGVDVAVVGMEEFNATTDGEGHYSMQVPYLEVGHSLSFTHPDLQAKQASTGPMTEDDWVIVNVTMAAKPPWATLTIRILPWDQPGSNYGLRQDVMTVVNMTGTPVFEWSEKSAEEDASVPAPGSYLVTGTRPGYYPVSQLVTVDRGDRQNVDLDMTGHKKPTYGWVNGTIEHDGFALPFVTVVAEPEEGTRTYEAVTGTDGKFSMQLPNGTYKVYVEADGYAKLSQGVDVELGKGVEVRFPMTIAQETGAEGSPLAFWAVLIASMAILGSVITYAMVTGRRTAAEEAAKAATKDELRCPACDSVASPDDDNCASCGAAFPWKSFRCPECGAVMGLDESRCRECGNQTFDLHRG